MTTPSRYSRTPIANNGLATCPCCLRAIRTTKPGRIVRHGWNETGRKVGEFGRGFQWGACFGGTCRPIEETDKDALKFADRMREAAVQARASADNHAAGEVSSYRTGVHFSRGVPTVRNPDYDEKVRGSRYSLDIEVTVGGPAVQWVEGIDIEGVPNPKYRHGSPVWTATVHKGHSDLPIDMRRSRYGASEGTEPKSWEGLRDGAVRHLTASAAGLEAAAARLDVRCDEEAAKTGTTATAIVKPKKATSPKGECIDCGHPVRLNKKGKIVNHSPHSGARSRYTRACPGSYRRPKAA